MFNGEECYCSKCAEVKLAVEWKMDIVKLKRDVKIQVIVIKAKTDVKNELKLEGFS